MKLTKADEGKKCEVIDVTRSMLIHGTILEVRPNAVRILDERGTKWAARHEAVKALT